MSSTGERVAVEQSFQPFYITGLPKSRTAWLSVALSDWRTSACLHEPLAKMRYETLVKSNVDGSMTALEDSRLVLSDLTTALLATHCPFAGLSDTGLAIVAADLPALLPGPVLIVWRDPGEVIKALVEYLGGDPEVHAGGVALMFERLQAFCERYSAAGALMQVDFESLSSTDTMRQIWRHLLPGGPVFQRRRIEALQRLRIEPQPEHLLDGITDSAMSAVKERFGA